MRKGTKVVQEVLADLIRSRKGQNPESLNFACQEAYAPFPRTLGVKLILQLF